MLFLELAKKKPPQEDSWGYAVIVNNLAAQKIVGIYTEADLFNTITQLNLSPELANELDFHKPVIFSMKTHPYCIAPEETLLTAIRKMSSGKFRRLPVCRNDGVLLGSISERTIIHKIEELLPVAIFNGTHSSRLWAYEDDR